MAIELTGRNLVNEFAPPQDDQTVAKISSVMKNSLFLFCLLLYAMHAAQVKHKLKKLQKINRITTCSD